MKKTRLTYVLIPILIFNFLNAQNVSLNTASKVAKNFLLEQKFNNAHAKDLLHNIDLKSNKLYEGLNNETLLYVFSINDKGFIIVAGDEKAYPILGYSLDNSFVSDNLPPAMLIWLDAYKSQISDFKNNQTESAYHDIWHIYKSDDINFLKNRKVKNQPPLIFTTWDQGKYYNALCPADPNGPGGHVYAGCVATTLAQIMKYHNYPIQGVGSHSYNDYNYGYQFADFGNTTYNWHDMPVYIDNYNDEIAQLLYHCGVALEMMYSVNGSGAWSQSVVIAGSFFDYDPMINFQYKSDYTDQDWENLIIDNLDALLPIYYAGYTSTGSGHAFNCDGYNQTGTGTLFHFNWGWSGIGNGYFYLHNLNSPGGSFNFSHEAVFDIIPRVGAAYPYNCSGTKTLTATAGTLEDGSGIYNYIDNADCYWLIDPSINVENIKLTFHSFDTEPSNDQVFVYDGDNISAPLLGVFSGNNIPPQLTSTGKKMLIHFQTNGSINNKGWRASYTTTKPIYCASMVTINDAQGILSDGSGTYKYHPNTNCRWRIMPQGAQTITLGFNDFSINTTDDFLRVIDIASNPNVLLDEYNGSQIPPTKTYNTSAIMVWFRSGQNDGEGWSAYYSSDVTSVLDDNAEDLSIFPNPFLDVLHIVLGNNVSGSFELFDINGKVISSDIITESREIVLNQLSNGLYFIKIIANNKVYHQKVIKQ